MELKGKIKVIGGVEQKGNLKIQYAVIETNEKYPQAIKVDFIGDNCNLLNDVKYLDEVVVKINLRGKEWTDQRTNEVKWFNSIQGWKIDKISEI